MKAPVILALATLASAGLASAIAAPVSYQLPEETATLKPGPNREVAQTNCISCHSADYISTQPQSIKPRRNFWQTEVTKMIKLYGAPIDDADVPKIVEYLAGTY